MENEKLHVCIDVELPPEKIEAAAAAAIKENPTNLRLAPSAFNMMANEVGVLPPARMALLTGKRWAPGKTLRVAFMHGDPNIIAKVVQYASEWMQHANIKLQFVNQWPADIRIAFFPGGSYSYMGTDALQIPMNQHTMNFGWFYPGQDDAVIRQTTLHEFGHALGCIHEHQHPQNPIIWNTQAVYQYYQQMGWSQAMVNSNVFHRYSQGVTNSAFDAQSIMQYPVPPQHTLNGFSVGMNWVLSPTDMQFIGSVYPGNHAAARAVTGLKAESFSVNGEIGKAGEEDHYHILVSNKNAYEFSTEGDTDVIMAIMKKDEPHNIIAQDDNSGKGKNARIQVELEKGEYLLRIKHFKPTGQGKYKVTSKVLELVGV